MSIGQFYTIKKRPDFVRMTSKGVRVAKAGLVVQTFHRTIATPAAPEGVVRIGFTATKKIGNATVRNRSKRRLRALVADLLPQYALAGNDYNFIARAATARMPFDRLRRDMIDILTQLKTEAERAST